MHLLSTTHEEAALVHVGLVGHLENLGTHVKAAATCAAQTDHSKCTFEGGRGGGEGYDTTVNYKVI